MRCHCGHEILKGGRSRTVLGGDGGLGVTAWGCQRCGGVMQQVVLLSYNGKARPQGAHYARFSGPV